MLRRLSNVLGASPRLLLVLAALVAGPAAAAPLAARDLPPALRDWLPWALQGQEARSCPREAGADAQGETRHCVWPSRLELRAGKSGASFRFEVMVAGPAALVALPGEPGLWPQEVQADRQRLAVVEQQGRPAVRLEAGRHLIEGQIPWASMPPGLLLPQQLGVLAFWLDGAALERSADAEGRLWLMKARLDEAPSADTLSLHTARLIEDQVPLRLSTHYELAVAGRAREIVLPHALLPGLVAESLSSALPLRLREDGSLVLQARAGRWTVDLQARSSAPVQGLSLPAAPAAAAASAKAAATTEGEAAPAGEEIWAFAANNDVRLVSVEGAPAVDPKQTVMPQAWQVHPAYRMQPGMTLKLQQTRRGNPEPAPDALRLQRQLWLDFDGRGFTAQDRIQGQVSRSSRLELAEGGLLGRAAIDGVDQPITRMPERAAQGAPGGFELRQGQANLSADSRWPAEGSGTALGLPASGWSADFKQLQTQLHLPPGWRLLHASGPDQLSSSWIARWTLWDFFFVLLSALAAGRLLGWRQGALLGAALLLSWHMDGAPRFLWLLWLGLLALNKALRAAAPLQQRLPRLQPGLHAAERLCLGLVALLLLPYAVAQVRLSLYPTLERPFQQVGLNSPERADSPVAAAAEAVIADEVAEVAAAAPAPAQEPDSNPYASRRILGSAKQMSAQQDGRRLQQMDPGARVQTGPGLPRWSWSVHALRWQGPVQAGQTLELYLLPPAGTAVLRLSSLLLMLAALLVLARAGARGGSAGPAPGSDASTLATEQMPPDSLISTMSQAMPTAGSAGTAPAASPAEPAVPAAGWRARLAAWRGHSRSEPGAWLLAGALSLGLLGAPGSSEASSPATAEAPSQASQATESGGPQPPSASLLEELRRRIQPAPECLPRCADLARLWLQAEGSRLQLRLEAHAQSELALPLPGQGSAWRPTQVLVDGRPAALRRDAQGLLWVALPAGVHQITMEGETASLSSLDLSLPMPVRELKTQLRGWSLSGLDARGLPSGALNLLRDSPEPSATSSAASDRSAEQNGNPRDALPPFVRIVRELNLGLRWTVETRIERVAPSRAPLRVQLQLISGEAVNDPAVLVQDGVASVQLGAAESYAFSSNLGEAGELRLNAARSGQQIEQWSLSAGTQWHVLHSGLAPIQHQQDGQWQPLWQPWPGEQLQLKISRPLGLAGQTLTLDQVHRKLSPGARATDVELRAALRASLGGKHGLRLPDGAELLSVSLDGQVLPLRAEAGLLTLPITPGAHQLQLSWREPRGISTLFKTQGLALGAAGVNDALQIEVPGDRVALALGGPAIGPAVLFWGVLLVVAGLALLLGRLPALRGLPMGSAGWLLLGLGLAPVSLAGLAAVVGWFLLLLARRRYGPGLGRTAFIALQLLLGFGALLVVLVLLHALQTGLLGRPDLLIQGNGSSAQLLNWYADRFSLEQGSSSAWLLSAPLWLYRLAMLLWALWLAASLLRWIQWGWEAYSTGGLWRERPVQAAKPGKAAQASEVAQAAGLSDPQPVDTESKP